MWLKICGHFICMLNFIKDLVFGSLHPKQLAKLNTLWCFVNVVLPVSTKDTTDLCQVFHGLEVFCFAPGPPRGFNFNQFPCLMPQLDCSPAWGRVEESGLVGSFSDGPQPCPFPAVVGRYHKQRPARGLVSQFKTDGPQLDCALAVLFHQKGCGLWTQLLWLCPSQLMKH